MSQLLVQITNNPLLVLSGWIMTLLALIIAIVVPIAQKKRKVLGFRYNTNSLVTDKLSEVEKLDVLFEGKRINQLSVTSIDIGNVGNVSIEDKDIYEGQELRITPLNKEISILYAKVISESDKIIECTTEKTNNNKIEVRFKAIDVKNNVVINVYHLGDCDTRFSVDGRIRAGKIVQLKPENDNGKALTRIQSILILLNAMVYCVFMYLVDIPDVFEKGNIGDKVFLTLLIVLCCLNIIMTFYSCLSIKSFPKD